MDNKDLEFITSKFESENINAPESLGFDKIEEKLEQNNGNIIKMNNRKTRFVKPVVAVAACFVIAIGTFLSVQTLNKNQGKVEPSANTASVELSGVRNFKSYDEIEKFINDIRAEKSTHFKYFKGGVFAKNETAADGATSANPASPSHSTTYTQVEGVDEADIIKTDGNYIYYIDSTGDTLMIYSVSDGKAEFCSKITVDNNDNGDKIFEEMYLCGDTIYLLGSDYNFDDGDFGTVVMSYDITDRANVKKTDEFRQSGSYSTSRMTGGSLYVISNFYAYDRRKVPYCSNGDGGFKKIPAEDICAFECCSTPGYAVVGVLDTSSGKQVTHKVKAVLGGADNVYCNTQNLYVACTDYGNRVKSSGKTESLKLTTEILKYSISDGTLKEQSTGTVEGYTNNQWAFDEKDGYLRVATTTNTKDGKDVNKLFVLDKDLKKVGEVENFAKNEHIEAVKYIDDYAYVITFERTDPLFVIDLSNPQKPQIKGEVKIDGFSTNLVPIGEDKLLGIGYSTSDSEWGGTVAEGVKAVLFDISDKNKPKVLDEKVYSYCYSEAQYTHKAILRNYDQDYVAIPVGSFDDYGGGALVFKEKGGKIEVVKKYQSDFEVSRVVNIGSTVYAVDYDENNIGSFTVK